MQKHRNQKEKKNKNLSFIRRNI